MAVISSVLAIIGLIILTVAVFALMGAGSTASALGLGEGLTSALTGIGSLIASYWQIFAALFTIGLIAIVARGSGSNGSAVDTAIGAAEGVRRAMTDGGEPVTNPNPDSNPSPSPSPSEPADIQDPTNPSDRSDSSGSSRNNRNNRGSADYRPRGDEETARGNSPRNRSNINGKNNVNSMANDLDLLHQLMEDEEEAKKLHQKVTEMEGNEDQYLKVIAGIENTLQESGVFDELNRFENDNIGNAQFYNEMHKIGETFADNFHGNVPGVATGGILKGTANNIDELIEADSTGADSGLIALYNGLVALEHYIGKLDHVEHEITEVETTEVEDTKEEINLTGELKSHHMQHLRLLQKHLK